jgi:hypothetical protein
MKFELSNGDEYDVLIKCSVCLMTWLQRAVWGPSWEVDACGHCSGRARTVSRSDDPERSIWVPKGCLLIYEETNTKESL